MTTTFDSFLALPATAKRGWFDMCVADSVRLKTLEQRMEFLHTSNRDAEGYEYGVARVKFSPSGEIESFLWSLSDSSDVDAAMCFNEANNIGA